jgi:hypothetical protein
MSTLAEIEAAADALPAEQKQQLLLFLASRLRQETCLPQPRQFNSDQIAAWVSQDEDDLNRYLQQKQASK